MRVLVCPDKFAGTLSAAEVAAAIASGWREGAPGDDVVELPLADGGPGFLSCLAIAPSTRMIQVVATGPLGAPVRAGILVRGDIAYLESAQICGLHLLAADERDPARATSYGLGQALLAAVELGVRRVVVGLGGVATNDGGAGMLAALDAAPLDPAGYALPYGPVALLGCAALGGVPRLRAVELVAAADVDNPLVGPDGTSAVFGPQKGATAAQIEVFDAALSHFATVLERCLPGCPPGLAALPGSGAAGGLGAALLACGARREPGFDVVARAVGLSGELDRCDLVVTGEGRVDAGSLRGKVVGAVLAAGAPRQLPVLVLAGQCTLADPLSGPAVHTLAEHYGDVASALRAPAPGLRALARNLAANHRRRG